MRTTLTIDDALLKELKAVAHREGVPLKTVIDRALRAGLAAMRAPTPRRPFRMQTFAMGKPRVENLDKALAVADALEDEEIVRELAVRK